MTQKFFLLFFTCKQLIYKVICNYYEYNTPANRAHNHQTAHDFAYWCVFSYTHFLCHCQYYKKPYNGYKYNSRCYADDFHTIIYQKSNKSANVLRADPASKSHFNTPNKFSNFLVIIVCSIRSSSNGNSVNHSGKRVSSVG